ncbi:vWA domain-containing protein [Actinoplanes sp. NPDC049265]|uniref:vWA domain-containing protein n=1 Tax=Actinoplanes sp. NPDC049265 TaxID=3363902 RepID=UPI0037206C71
MDVTPMPTTARRRRSLLPAFLVLVALSGPLGLAGPEPARAREDDPVLPSMQVVVLVDESGSLSDADVAREREAARTIAFSVLAPDSELSVVGFGSSNGPGQTAVDVVCKPTVLTAEQDRDALANCISGLKRRAPGEGADTDHASALQQALSYVRAGKSEHKVVFLLTDGKLDVANSPAWGDTGARRNGAAQADANRTLDDLAAAKAQVWPLGFGAVDPDALSGFARGQSCTPAAGDPRERIVSDSSKLTAAVAEAFSSASCVKYQTPDVGAVPRGGDTKLHGDIPAIASEASILVYKRDKRVQVEYLAPGESKPAPDAGGSHFEFAGQSTELETIKISDPKPGRWTIRLSSADVAAEDVSATVVYQAAVRTYLTVNPPQPAPGQSVDIEMQVWARNRAITDAAALSGLNFTATMNGAGLAAAEKIPLSDADRDGTFAGKVRLPDAATGNLTFTGQVTGLGIGGDTRVLNTRIQPDGLDLTASILFDVNRAEAYPGSEISGRITARNDSGRAARLRIVVADPSAGTDLAADPPVIDVAPGASTVPYTLRIGEATTEGPGSATLRLVDDADPSVVVSERLFATQFTHKPTVWERYRWLLLGLAVLIAVVAGLLFLRWRARDDEKKLRGITVQLFVSGARSDELPGDPNSKVLRFTVVRDFSGPHLQPAGAREPGAYTIRRSGTGLVYIGPDKQSTPLAAGTRRQLSEPDLSIVVMDGGDDGETGPDTMPDFNPFPGAAPTTAGGIPEQRAEAPTSTAPQDPFAAGDPFDPFAQDAGPARESRNGHAPPTASPAGGGTFDDDLNNPFR